MEGCNMDENSSTLGIQESDRGCENDHLNKTDSTTSDDASKAERTSGTDVEDLERTFRMMKFDEYDFTKDEQFQNGWKKLSAVVPADQVDKQLLKAKIFYYSKHIEPIDIPEYFTWKNRLSNKTKNSSLDNEISKGGNSCEPIGTSGGDEEVRLTFSEVMECVKSGREIPGLKKIEVQTTDTDPSPSVLERKTKPWEHG